MSEARYIEIPGSGRVRVATSADLRRSQLARDELPATNGNGAKIYVMTRPGRSEALTAAAQNADRNLGALLRLDQPWQREAMRIYRTSGECWNPAQYYSRAMERIRYYPAIRNARGVPEEVTEGPLVDLFRRITSPSGAPGDLSEIAGQYARLQFVIGDGLLAVTDDGDGEVWEYLSPMELRLLPRSDRLTRQEYRRYRAPGVPPEELTEAPDNEFEATGIDQARVWRLWRRHPEFSQWADSPIRPVIDLYETLGRLTLAVHAEASSRAAQRGIFFIPSEFSYGPVDQTQEENPEEDPLLKDISESAARAIRDPGSAEAMQPFYLRGPGVTNVGGGSIPTKDLLGWMAMGPADRYLEGDMWDKTIGRIAGSIDMPKELMVGIADVNHWCCTPDTEILTADGWKTHDQLCVGEEVYTLNHVTGMSEFEPLWDVARFDVVDEPMLSMEGNCHSSMTTMNHRWPTVSKRHERRHWRTSETLDANQFVITGAPNADLPTEPKHPDALVELAAWVWAEGTIRERPGRANPVLRIYQSLKRNPENVAHIRRALTDLYGPALDGSLHSSRRGAVQTVPAWNERERENGMNVFGLNVAAARPLVALMPQKIVPREFIRELTASQLELFIETAIRGDGSNRSTQSILFQKDGRGLEAIELAAILLGRSLHRYRKHIKGFTDHAIEVVSIHKRARFGPRARHKKTISYTGTIWCPVTGNRTWLARRNGHVFYTGNSAWFLDDVGFRQHTGPTVIRFCNDIAAAYLRPAAKAADIPKADQVMVWFDASQAINHPDETGVARDAHDRLVVSDEWYRGKIGASDGDAPDAEELKRRTDIKLKIDPDTGQPARTESGATTPGASTAPPDGGRGGDVVQGPPTDSQTRPPGNKPPSPSGPSLAAQLLGAAEMQVLRARELAGNRLWRRAQSCDDCRNDARDVPKALIAATLGADRVRSIIDGHTNEADLVNGIGDAFAEMVRSLGVNGGWPEQLGKMVEQHALRTMFETEVPRMPSGFFAACQRAVDES